MHPDDTVPDMQLAVYDPASSIAGDRARPEAEDGNEVIMYSFDVVVDQQCESLRQTMINLCQLIHQVEQLLITGTAIGQRFPDGDHSLPMAPQGGQSLINLSDVAGYRVAQLARRVRYLPGDV